GKVNQGLPEEAAGAAFRGPGLFQDFVAFEELAAVEKIDAELEQAVHGRECPRLLLRHGNVDGLAAAVHQQHRGAVAGPLHGIAHFGGRAYRLAGHFLNDVALLDAGLGRGPGWIHLGDHHALRPAPKSKLRGDLRREWLGGDSQAAAGFPAAPALLLLAGNLAGPFAQPDTYLLLRRVAPDGKGHLHAGRHGGDFVAEDVGVAHAFPVELQDNVALFQTRLVRRAAGGDGADDDAARFLESEARGEIAGNALYGDADHAALHFTLPDQLVHHRLGHVGGDGEANADVDAGGRENLGVDPDQLPARIHQRAARVALVDGRVGLQEVLEAAIAQTRGAALGADDARGYGFADAQRIANRQANVTHAHLIGVAGLQNRQVAGANLQPRQIAGRVRPPPLRGIRTARADEIHLDLVRAIDDVMVGEDVPVGAHDHARAQRFLHLRAPFSRNRPAEKLAEKRVVGERELLRSAHPLRRPYGHHRRCDAVHHVAIREQRPCDRRRPARHRPRLRAAGRGPGTAAKRKQQEGKNESDTPHDLGLYCNG